MSQAPALRVFISYARRDCTEFADELLAGLEVAGFDPFLDRHDIAGGEDWEQRLSGLISAADTVVFVLSPASITSERCAWEVAKAEQLSKRIIPIVAIEVPEADTPQGLKRLNYIFFSQGNSFARSLGELANTLRVDLDWIREHTRLADLAARWRDRNKSEVLLLRGSELAAAKAWLNDWKAGVPEPSDLHRAFISESDSAENAALGAERTRLEEMAAAQSSREAALKSLSRRTTFGLVGAGGLTAVAAGLAYWGVNAEGRFRQAQRESQEAQANDFRTLIANEVRRTDVFGQLTAYSASPGEIAADGRPGETSPYTKAVLEELTLPNASLQVALAKSHARVAQTSSTGQQPYASSNLNADVFLRHRSPTRRLKAIVISMSGGGDWPALNTAADREEWTRTLSECGFDTVSLDDPNIADVTRALDGLSFASLDARPGREEYSVRPTGFAPAVRRGEEEQEPLRPPSPVQVHERLYIQPPIPRSDYAAPPDTMIAIFYAGLGLHYDGENYLALRGTSIASPADLIGSALSVSRLERLARARAAASVVVLDTNFTVLKTTPPPAAAR